jgi:uroporphyrinogen III methyltransferase/synthase
MAGEVEGVRLQEQLPLTGATVLVTRAKSQASALVDQLQAQGAAVWEFPVITIADPESWAPLDAAIAQLAQYRWLVITSPNGAEKFAARLTAGGKGPADLAGVKVAAVGSTTAKTLRGLGIEPALIPPEFRGGALPDAMAPHLQPGDRILMTRANLADPAVAERLRALGCEVDDVIAYRTLLEGGDVAALRDALRHGEITYVTLTSSSTVNNLIDRLGGVEWLSGVRVAVMGPETRRAAVAAGLAVSVMAEEVSVSGLVNAIVVDRGLV